MMLVKMPASELVVWWCLVPKHPQLVVRIKDMYTMGADNHIDRYRAA